MATSLLRSQDDGEPADMQACLAAQKTAFDAEGYPSKALRIDRLRRAHDLLGQFEAQICDALMEDYGYRSKEQSFFVEVMTTAKPFRDAIKNVGRWMKPEKRSAGFPFNMAGASAEVRYQPLGVVGCISPWNFPVNLTFMPLAGILAAGNRAMVKPSEFTPNTAELMREMFASAFTPEEIAVFTGGPDVAAAFSALPFDHLLYTGGENVAKHIMRAAAENLVPVTLELGGKSPVILGKGANLKLAADRILFGKIFNAGQVCLSPDYLFVQKNEIDSVAAALVSAAENAVPKERGPQDLVSIVNARHAERLRGYTAQAKDAGTRVIELDWTGGQSDAQANMVPITLLIDPDDDQLVMREEVFGPLLPIKTYDTLGDVSAFIRSRPAPLALYYFGSDQDEIEHLLGNTRSGGVTVNDVIMHYTIDDLPFGGVGASGMGAYHGFDGFKQFSHARAIYRQSKLDVAGALRPPYGPTFQKMSRFLFKHG
ncbi:MAG: coniferyl aldehyde dehydrogenase [Pseudomonadota bacterium]